MQPTRPFREQNGHRSGGVVRHSYIGDALAVKVAKRRSKRIGPGGKTLCFGKSTVAFAEKQRDSVASGIRRKQVGLSISIEVSDQDRVGNRACLRTRRS